jgi:tRNA U34 2-thiouridine synthase MnmA/TrmU
MEKEKARAILMLSGGLDSILAGKLLQEQGIKVIGLNFYSDFFGNDKAIKAAEQLRIPFKTIKLGKDFIKMIQSPKHGRGVGLNPCIDCKIFMLKKAKELMFSLDADFIATGEVLNERPMSQYRGALMLIEKEAGLSRRILRPLSAKELDPTEMEEKGLVNRSKLMDIQGRQRKIQIKMAEKYKISYPAPAGGCLLCEKAYSAKLADLFKNKEANEENIRLLRLGRHFRFNNQKIIVGRNHEENIKLMEIDGIKFIPAKNIPGPTTVLIGGGKAEIRKAAELTAFYSDKKEPIDVEYGKDITKLNNTIFVAPPSKEEVEKLRI